MQEQEFLRNTERDKLANLSLPKRDVIERIDFQPDLEQLQQAALLYSEAFSGPPWFEKWTEKKASNTLLKYLAGGSHFSVVQCNEQIVALAITSIATEQRKLYERFPSQIPENTLYLAEIAVLRTFQGQGMGKRLLSAIIENAKRDNFQAIVTRTRFDNDSAISLFVGQGMTCIGKYEAKSGGITSERTVFLKTIE